MELVIASSNTQKVMQIREILKDIAPRATVLSLFDFPDYVLPEYDPTLSLVDNAKLKASHAASTLQKCCLAEQWELILPALGDEVKKIFAQNSTTNSQTKMILASLAGKSEHERTSYIESCIVCTQADGKERQAIGRVEGTIAEQERGKGSSDFDSIFIKHDYMKTLAELSPSVRSRISHRRKALEKLVGFLETLR